MSRTYLYRFFEAENRLLYIGISKTVLARMAQHFSTKDWIPNDGYLRWTSYPTRLLAQEAERQAIISEKPKWNVLFNEEPSDIDCQAREPLFISKVIPAWLLEA